MTKMLLGLASAALVALAAAPAAASTLEIISGPTGQRAITLPPFGPIGQSFTAFEENLSSVGFQFKLFNSPWTNSPFSLSLLSGSTLTGPALYSKSFSLPDSMTSTNATWFDIDITGWDVTLGQSYTFVLSNSSYRFGVVLGPEINIFTGEVLGTDAYAGGKALFTTPPYYAGRAPFCETSAICDLNFRVTGTTATVPDPASWALMIAGMGVLGNALRRRTRRIA